MLKELNEEIFRLTNLRKEYLEQQQKDLKEEFLKLEWLSSVKLDFSESSGDYFLSGKFPEKFRDIFEFNKNSILLRDYVFINKGYTGDCNFNILSRNVRLFLKFIEDYNLINIYIGAGFKDKILLYQKLEGLQK